MPSVILAAPVSSHFPKGPQASGLWRSTVPPAWSRAAARQPYRSTARSPEVTRRKCSLPTGGGEGRWRRPAAGEERGHGAAGERPDSRVMASSPHTLSSRLLTGTARALGHDFGKILLFLSRVTPWFRLAATLGALGEVGWAPVRGRDLCSSLKRRGHGARV